MPPNPAEELRADRIRLTHMLEAARRVARYCAGMTAQSLNADEMRFLAVLKSIEIVGEASLKIGPATQSRLAAIDWTGIRGMRNRLIHGYDSIDPARVWDAVELDIWPLIAALEGELANEAGPGSAGV